MLKLTQKLLGYDRNVITVLIYRVWVIFAGIITIFSIPRFLSINEQGYYYTFLSVVALQVLFDLGLSQTVTQVTSHEFAHIELMGSYDVRSNAHIGKLAYIKSAVTRWYHWVGGAFVLAVSIFGVAYFGIFGRSIESAWIGPWLLLVVTTGINLALSPKLAMVEGAGWTGAVANLRLFQSVAGYCLLVGCLMGGGRLWSVAAVPGVASICTFIWLRWAVNPYRSIPAYISRVYNDAPWRSEIMGLQWRVGVAWLGGYFGSQVFVPVVFALQGAREAGRLGLGLQIFTAIQGLGMSWVSARMPLFGQLISRRDWAMLKAQFAKAALGAALVTTVFSAVVAIVLTKVGVSHAFMADRVPSSFAIAVLSIVAIFNTIIYVMAAYMRAHKEEPLVISSLVVGIMTFITVFIAGHVSTNAVVLSYAAVAIAINLPWTLLLFLKYYRRNIRAISLTGE